SEVNVKVLSIRSASFAVFVLAVAVLGLHADDAAQDTPVPAASPAGLAAPAGRASAAGEIAPGPELPDPRATPGAHRPAFWMAAAVLLAVYGVIASELLHRTLAAFVGAAAILFISYTLGTFDPGYRILTFAQAVEAIDLNVVFLLLSMMIIVGITMRTGLFQWLAYKAYQISRGNAFALAAILMGVTALASSFLDNVTTMMLIIPVTLRIAAVLRISPVTLLLPEVFASNVGGTATLIGDPPNIMIGSFAGLTFVDFIVHLTLVCVLALAVSGVYFWYWFRKDYAAAHVEDVEGTILQLRAAYGITDRKLLVYCGVAIGLTILLFFLHGVLEMEASVAAMTGAALLLVLSRVEIVDILKEEIEWPILVFFMMLFVVVAAAEQTGLIQVIADWVHDASGGSLLLATVVVLWVSAVVSSVVDNIPFTATMLPVVAYLTRTVPGAGDGILWWALALGACLGGNATLIGASANVVTVGFAEREGHHISFRQYLEVAAVPTLITLVLATLWLVAAGM
ncbi:MAG: ArsB/NhaD family transporter, partial [Gemmatimonadota bacterium]